MKKLICLILCIAMIPVCFTVQSAAGTCNHIYKSQHLVKNCVSAAGTVYTCISCGDSYTVYDWEYTVPEGFALVYNSIRDEEKMTLTVTVELLNNPGLLIARTLLAYNSATLKPISFENGTVWEEDDYFREIDLTSNPITVYTEEKTDVLNKKSGLYHTFVFSILDPDGDYGFEIVARKTDFSDYLYQPHQPEVIDRIGKKELGQHSFSEPEVIIEPTFDTVGTAVCHCVFCDEPKYEDVPVLTHWKRGDVNNDGKINAGDCILLKKIVVGKVACNSLQMKDAADLNHDNKINAGDAIEIKKIVVGKA